MGVILAVMGRVRCRVTANSVSLAAVCQNAALIAQAYCRCVNRAIGTKRLAKHEVYKAMNLLAAVVATPASLSRYFFNRATKELRSRLGLQSTVSLLRKLETAARAEED